jgi:hypothetical protein
LKLYFRHPVNGTYHRVPPRPVEPLLHDSDGAVGGITVYYTQFDLMRDNLARQPIKAFPPVSDLGLFRGGDRVSERTPVAALTHLVLFTFS